MWLVTEELLTFILGVVGMVVTVNKRYAQGNQKVYFQFIAGHSPVGVLV